MKDLLFLKSVIICFTQITIAQINTDIHSYDQLGRIVKIEYANGVVEEISYDNVGNRSGYILDISSLPVELTKFTAYPVPNEKLKAVIEWTTASEINTDFFEVQHSLTGSNFRKIGIVKAAGQSEEPINYQLRHEEPDYSINYYRLITNDIDGSSQKSQIVTVTFQEDYAITLFPNPTRGIAILQLKGEFRAVSNFKVTNMLGQSFSPSIKNIGENTWEIDAANLPSGMYQIAFVIDGVDEVINLLVDPTR